MHAREPDLLQVFGAAVGRRQCGTPEVGPEESPPLVERDRVPTNLDIRVIGGEWKS
jgi:hypothetical protein